MLIGKDEFEGLCLVEVVEIFVMVNVKLFFGENMLFEICEVVLWEFKVYVVVCQDGLVNYDIVLLVEEMVEIESSVVDVLQIVLQ